MKKLSTLILASTAFLSACASPAPGAGISTPMIMTAEVSTVMPGGGGTLASPEPPGMIPTLAGGVSATEVKYRLLEQFPDFFFCDPDLYPIAREDEGSLAQQNFPELQADQEEFQAILAHLDFGGQTTFTDEQKLQIYREHKRLNALVLQPAGGRYQFQIQTGAEGQPGTVITGTIDGRGSIDVLQREASMLSCPICLAAGTLIDTPRGFVRVEELQVGDAVWTQDKSGRRVIASIARTGHVKVPAGHRMLHLTLSDGRQLWASPGHPATDGQRLDGLRIGDFLDGARVVNLEQVPYGQVYTFDILPSGDTGVYRANGIWLGSTLSYP